MLIQKINSINTYNQNISWSSAEATLALVKQQLIELPIVSMNDALLSLGTLNAEYLWQTKALHFIDSYKEIVTRHHILALQEVSKAALSVISTVTGYKYFVSRANSRGQANGFLVNSRLQILDIIEHNQITQILDTPNLRPALQIRLYDPINNLNFSMISVHLKSMLGDSAFTAQVRRLQMEKLGNILGTEQEAAFIMGDFNCFLDTTQDTQALYANDFMLSNAEDHQATHKLGGRLDGLFHKHLPSSIKLSQYSVNSFWHSGSAGSSLSDHSLLSWHLISG